MGCGVAGSARVSPQHALGAQPEVAFGAEEGAVSALVEHLLAGFWALRSVALISWQPINVKFAFVLRVILMSCIYFKCYFYELHLFQMLFLRAP